MPLVGGLDWGGRVDATALAALEAGDPHRLIGLDHIPASGMTFDDQLRGLAPSLFALDVLAFDAGGVGQALGELLPPYLKPGALLIPVTITGGSGQRESADGRVSLGKHRLIGAMATAARDGRLTVAPNAPGADILAAEMASFAHNGRGGMEAQRGHDDAVLATALGVWLAETLAQQDIPRAAVDAGKLMQRKRLPNDWRCRY